MLVKELSSVKWNNNYVYFKIENKWGKIPLNYSF